MSRLKFALLPVTTAVTLAGWAADPLALPEGFTLSEPMRFVTVIDSSECQLLRFNGLSFGYVAHVADLVTNELLEQQYLGEAWTGTPKTMRRMPGLFQASEPR